MITTENCIFIRLTTRIYCPGFSLYKLLFLLTPNLLGCNIATTIAIMKRGGDSVTFDYQEKLKQFVEEQGPEVVLDQDKCEEMLEIYLGDNQLVLRTLLLAQKEGIPHKLLNTENIDKEALYQVMYQKLDAMTGMGRKHGLLYGFARESVRTWAYGLGVTLPPDE